MLIILEKYMPVLRTPGPEIQMKPDGINDKLESDMLLCLNIHKNYLKSNIKRKKFKVNMLQ